MEKTGRLRFRFVVADITTIHYQLPMTIDQAVELSRAAVMMALLIGAPVMLTAIVAGLVISILQAVTQIQDQTLSFVPKIVAMILALLFLLPWILQQMTEYSSNLIRDIPNQF